MAHHAVTTSEPLLLTAIYERLKAFEPRHIPANKMPVRRASVAAILRWRPSPSMAGHVESCNDPETFLKQPWVRDDEQGAVEILFMRRATRTSDRWSGHVAFPGGKGEKGESDLETAVREVEEEIGLNLRSKDFTMLGQLDEREVLSSQEPRPLMILIPFVFLQLTPDTPTMKLQTSEVAGVQWVALSFFLSSKPYPVQLGNGRVLARCQQKVLRYLGSHLLGTMALPAIELPTDSHHGPPFRLWGLTLGMTRDIIEILLQPSSPDNSARRHPQGQFIVLAERAPTFSRRDLGYLTRIISQVVLMWRLIRGDFKKWSRWRYQRESENVYYMSIRQAVKAGLLIRISLFAVVVYLIRWIQPFRF